MKSIKKLNKEELASIRDVYLGELEYQTGVGPEDILKELKNQYKEAKKEGETEKFIEAVKGDILNAEEAELFFYRKQEGCKELTREEIAEELIKALLLAID